MKRGVGREEAHDTKVGVQLFIDIYFNYIPYLWVTRDTFSTSKINLKISDNPFLIFSSLKVVPKFSQFVLKSVML